MANLYWLDRIQPGHRSLVGNKAFHLGKLLQKGYPVVPGFAVSAQVFRDFLETLDWSEPLFADLPYSSLRLDIENPRQLQAIAQRIRQAIKVAPLPSDAVSELRASVEELNSPIVVLRPSLAFHSNAEGNHLLGLEPVINGRSSALFNTQVCGVREDELVEGLKQLWSDLFGAKSLFYWQRLGVSLQQVSLAVLIQPLWSAIAAGSVRGDGVHFEVQSAPGLGMAIVWGETIPDFHTVHAESGTTLLQRLGKKVIAYQPVDKQENHFQLESQFLSEAQQSSYALEDQQLGKLVQLVQRLEAEAGAPLEIEWVLGSPDTSNPEFYLTQGIFGLPVASTQFNQSPEALVSVTTPNSSPIVEERLSITGLAVSQGQAIARAKVIVNPHESPQSFLPGTVLVAAVLPPHWLPFIKQAAAIVTEQGGMTSHSAIVAREVGVPAVMGVANVTRELRTGDLVVVDGNQGRVYRLEREKGKERENVGTDLPVLAREQPTLAHSLIQRPWSNEIESAGEAEGATVEIRQETDDFSSLITDFSLNYPDRPPIGTQLMVNLSQPDLLERLTELPVDGIGLLRSELLAISLLDNQHPDLWLQQGRDAELTERLTDALCQFTSTLSPRPVFYRSFDLRSHEFRGLAGGEETAAEVNPMLGMRGTFSYMMRPRLFELELAALLRVQKAGYNNIRLMLPFVRTVEEFDFCYQRVKQSGLTRNPHFQIWIMAEVPSALFLLPAYAKAGVQGISIGSNDLTQLILGVDRDYAPMANAFDEQHPAVKAAIAQLIQQSNQVGIPCSICGQAPARYPEMIEDLIRWGIRSVSVDLDAVESTYWAIARAERQLLLEAARQQ